MTTPHQTPEPVPDSGAASRPPDGGEPRPEGGREPVEAAREEIMAALSDIDDASGWPPADQVAAYAAAHRTLQATLARIDDH